jgi:uncharacterized protein YcfL
MNKISMVLLSALLLVACNDNDDDAIAKPAVVSPSPDSFTLNVKAELLQSADDTEPKSIDSVALVTVEDAEPIEIN